MKTCRLSPNLSIIDVAPPVPGFEEFISVYVLEAGKVALVDTGPSGSVDSLISGLRELNIEPADISYIFATHIHMDHAGGVGKAIKQIDEMMSHKGQIRLSGETSPSADDGSAEVALEVEFEPEVEEEIKPDTEPEIPVTAPDEPDDKEVSKPTKASEKLEARLLKVETDINKAKDLGIEVDEDMVRKIASGDI